jgi:hypothetical protein
LSIWCRHSWKCPDCIRSRDTLWIHTASRTHQQASSAVAVWRCFSSGSEVFEPRYFSS